MREQQAKKHCQTFMNKLQNTNIYDNIRQLLISWKKQDNKLNVPAAIDTFIKISKAVHGCGQEDKDQKLIQYFNRCLVKEAIVPKKTVTTTQVEDLANGNPQANQIIDNIKQWVKKQKQIKIPQKNIPKTIPVLQQIKDNALMGRLQTHPKFRQIIKIIQLYLKSIITYDEIKILFLPLFISDPSLIGCLIQTAEEIIQKRRKATIFASLNQLVDKKYPNLQQVGQSYILIPEGYANYSKTWKTNKLQYIMNRQCVSVPLGSEVSFIINKKTDYEEQLFNYEDQRYQIDNTLCSLRAVILLLQSSVKYPHKLQSPLLQRIINDVYPNENVGNIFMRQPQLARNVLLPRIIQKRDELMACRDKFIKICQQVASKNFYKSLDYRCFYFAKNDKKFNCPTRWQKQIDMRKVQIMQKNDSIEKQQIEDRQSLQRGRYFYVNSFDNITKQNFIENKQIENIYQKKIDSKYPIYPQNQILFILNFNDQQVLNDVLQIILYNCTRRNLLELLIFKLMRTDIKKKLTKSPILNHLIQTKEKIANSSQIQEIVSNLKSQSYLANLQQQGFPMSEEVLLNQNKGFQKNFKDSQQQFMQMIEQDQQPIQLQEQPSPFEGPENGYTLIGTKQMYLFLRYVTTIYQRFCKAKEYSDQLSCAMNMSENGEEKKQKIDIYKFFLTVMIYKIKDRKYFQQYLRKIFCKNAFIFFTLQKMILSAAKIINNISGETLTYQIIKDQTKDYELGAFDWQKFTFPSITMQLTRLYLQQQPLFRFTFQPNEKNFYISSWNPPFKQYFSQNQRSEQLAYKMEQYITQPIKMQKDKLKHKKFNQKAQQVYRGEQKAWGQNGKLILDGQTIILSKDRDNKYVLTKNIRAQIIKLKKIRRSL